MGGIFQKGRCVCGVMLSDCVGTGRGIFQKGRCVGGVFFKRGTSFGPYCRAPEAREAWVGWGIAKHG